MTRDEVLNWYRKDIERGNEEWRNFSGTDEEALKLVERQQLRVDGFIKKTGVRLAELME